MRRIEELHGVVLDREITFTLSEFCSACGVDHRLVVEMIEEGIIEPVDGDVFHGESLVRARRALRLVNDLGVNWPGAALALDLLEQIEAIHRRNPNWRRL